ncbi:MAG: hypothetical protein RIG61_07430 [Deltaproteobacteria bacterium]
MLPADMRDTVNRERAEEVLSGLAEKEGRALELRFGFIDGKMLSYEKKGAELGMTNGSYETF